MWSVFSAALTVVALLLPLSVVHAQKNTLSARINSFLRYQSGQFPRAITVTQEPASDEDLALYQQIPVDEERSWWELVGKDGDVLFKTEMMTRGPAVAREGFLTIHYEARSNAFPSDADQSTFVKRSLIHPNITWRMVHTHPADWHRVQSGLAPNSPGSASFLDWVSTSPEPFSRDDARVLHLYLGYRSMFGLDHIPIENVLFDHASASDRALIRSVAHVPGSLRESVDYYLPWQMRRRVRRAEKVRMAR